jgi:serine/threonine-protein kinase
MPRLLLALLMLIIVADSADARRRHHRYQYYYAYPQDVIPQDGRTAAPDREDRWRARDTEDDFRDGRDNRRSRRDSRDSRAGFVPPTWQLQAPDPNWHGKRFVSPDGTAWLATYASAAEKEAVADHMKTVAFADGEQITYLRGERSWIAVSGFKGDRIFYRKAVLACGGRVWRHVALEYPAEHKRSLDPFVQRASAVVDATANEACDTAVSSPAPSPAGARESTGASSGDPAKPPPRP